VDIKWIVWFPASSTLLHSMGFKAALVPAWVFKSHSNHIVMYWSILYQFPSCNLFTQHAISLWRDTSSELWIPVLFPLLINSTAIIFYLLSANIYFHSIRLILCVQQISEIDNRTASGVKHFGCVVCRFNVVSNVGSAPCH
jgi:hypothetical protein